jgi:hypothetical protein
LLRPVATNGDAGNLDQLENSDMKADKKRSVVPIVIARNKVNFESNKMMNLRLKMSAPY